MRINLTEDSNQIKVYKVLFRCPDASREKPVYSTPFMDKKVSLDIVEGRQNFASSNPHFVLSSLEERVSRGYIHSYSALHYAISDYLHFFLSHAKRYNCVPVIFECEIPVNDISNHCFIGEFDSHEKNGYCSKELRFLREVPKKEIEDCIMSMIEWKHWSEYQWSVYCEARKDNKIRELFSADHKLMRRYLKSNSMLHRILKLFRRYGIMSL